QVRREVTQGGGETARQGVVEKTPAGVGLGGGGDDAGRGGGRKEIGVWARPPPAPQPAPQPGWPGAVDLQREVDQCETRRAESLLVFTGAPLYAAAAGREEAGFGHEQ